MRSNTESREIKFAVGFPFCASTREAADAVLFSEREGFKVADVAEDPQLLSRGRFRRPAVCGDPEGSQRSTRRHQLRHARSQRGPCTVKTVSLASLQGRGCGVLATKAGRTVAHLVEGTTS
jgi:hypothetical protein